MRLAAAASLLGRRICFCFNCMAAASLCKRPCLLLLLLLLLLSTAVADVEVTAEASAATPLLLALLLVCAAKRSWIPARLLL
jgi:hypothetical protein